MYRKLPTKITTLDRSQTTENTKHKNDSQKHSILLPFHGLNHVFVFLAFFPTLKKKKRFQRRPLSRVFFVVFSYGFRWVLAAPKGFSQRPGSPPVLRPSAGLLKLLTLPGGPWRKARGAVFGLVGWLVVWLVCCLVSLLFVMDLACLAWR